MLKVSIKTAKKWNSNAKRCIFVCKIKCNTMFFNMNTIDMIGLWKHYSPNKDGRINTISAGIFLSPSTDGNFLAIKSFAAS